MTISSKLLFLSQWFEPEPTMKGVRFVAALRDASIDTEVVTGFPNYPTGKIFPGYRLKLVLKEDMDGVPVTRLPLYPSHDASTLRRMANYLSFFLSSLFYLAFTMRRWKLAYVYHAPITPALAAALAGMLWRRPFILEIQDLWPDSLSASGMAPGWVTALLGRICNFVYRRAAHIVVQSDGMIETLVARGVPREKMTRIYNWSNYRATMDPTPVTAFDEQHFDIVYGGNLGQAQALDVAIRAAKAAQVEAPQIRLHLLGSGIEGDKLKALATEIGADNVLFHGRVEREDADRYFEQADALLLHLADDPLYDITIPSKTQHYLSVGKPIIAGIGGEAASLLERSGAAIVSAPGDSDAMACAMVTLAKTDRHDDRGAKAIQFYGNELDFTRAMARTMQVIRNVADV